MKKYVLFIIPFVLIFLSFARAEKTNNPGNDNPNAPDFTLQDLKGNDISLSDYEGKVVFLNFWATWCGPCKKEIPGFVEIYRQYKNKGMEIIGISLDKTGSRSITDFVEKYKINYPVGLATKKILRDYEPGRFIPITFVIDPEGKIRHRHVGYLDKETLKNYFLDLIEENK